jgi:hypothetical protein
MPSFPVLRAPYSVYSGRFHEFYMQKRNIKISTLNYLQEIEVTESIIDLITSQESFFF